MRSAGFNLSNSAFVTGEIFPGDELLVALWACLAVAPAPFLGLRASRLLPFLLFVSFLGRLSKAKCALSLWYCRAVTYSRTVSISCSSASSLDSTKSILDFELQKKSKRKKTKERKEVGEGQVDEGGYRKGNTG